MKIDLHVHAQERSGCSVAPENEIIQRARAIGLDALVFTDHGRLVPADHLADLNRRHAPFRVFSGIEIHTAEEEDVLVYGLQNPELERTSWNYADLHQFVRARGGYCTLAHPFRYRETVQADIHRFPPDAVEARSLNLAPHLESRIRHLAAEIGSAVVYASDAHRVDGVGAFHVCLDGQPDSDVALVALLRTRAFVCCAADPAASAPRV
jgi:predicted metal-dependent phosphoesterase TrpH